MKYLAAFTQKPLVILISSLMGTTAIAYLQGVAIDALGWFIPCLAIILADLVAGTRAAKWRGEQVRISGALRRTGNKILCYGCWIVCCVALSYKYGNNVCAFVGMAVIFGVEAFSFVSNILEPHGLTLSVKGILHTLGRRHNLDGLEDVVEKKEEKK